MSDHTSAFVPFDAWSYSSPDVRLMSRYLDMGLLAEALIYYDCVFIVINNKKQLVELLQWFINQGMLDTFLSLLTDGTITIYNYSFITHAVEKDGVFSLWNVQFKEDQDTGGFNNRILYRCGLDDIVHGSRKRSKIYKAFDGRVIEAKADQFNEAIEEARGDVNNIPRLELALQAYINEIYSIKNLGTPPIIKASVRPFPDGLTRNITLNVNLDQLATDSGPEVNFHLSSPLTATANSCRLILSASSLGSDLYIGTPMSHLVGDKLYESSENIIKTHGVIESLQQSVDFPDVRTHINHGQLSFRDILAIREKAGKFRTWLQDESDRDRDAIIAYHNEVAKESGLLRGARKTLQLFGIVGGTSLGASIGAIIDGPVGAGAGAAIGSLSTYVLDLASKIGSNWRPTVFGVWYRERIADLLAKQDS